MNNQIAIVDSSADDGQLLKDILEAAGFGYQCKVITSAESFSAEVESDAVEVALIDQSFIDGPFLRRLQKWKRTYCKLRIYVLALEVTAQQLAQAQEHGIDGFCQKVDDYPALIDSIEQTIS